MMRWLLIVYDVDCYWYDVAVVATVRACCWLRLIVCDVGGV